MNICNKPKFLVNSKDKIINGKRRKSSKSYNLLNPCIRIFYETKHTSKRLENILKKKLNQKDNTHVMQKIIKLDFTTNEITNINLLKLDE
ncbi:hypothetical protein NMY3_01564 [Candidatus Nitrosocosmicus oleophilus]|jgi:hypothetical protein|uniref:Uncharacterized protein n=1 Tax=Candidatus Nitrosocosmicus oleophilus TaxID=1353260 RepID=A0A654LXM4_9ARCH|nr:hypothetical protein [Candidatus Nitrosocosmicus oleophilus]ALI35767.1 hypothetical protein NMY3_01564 [Candidatus Nitrosocosmicus oleophilus]